MIVNSVMKEKLEQILLPEKKIWFVLLFGSRAGKTPRPQSDIDIAIYLDPALSSMERFELRRDLIARLVHLGEPDLVILNDVPPFMAHQALLGQALFVRNQPAYLRFFVRTLGQSLDLQYYRNFHAIARKKRLLEERNGRS